MQIHQKAHQLGHRDSRVGVVELDRRLVGQGAHVAEILHVAAHDVLDRCGGEEELLAQPQLLAGGVGIGRIEHPRQALGAVAVGQGADVVAGVERVQTDRIEGLGGPQAQGVDPLAAPADHRRVDRHGDQPFGRPPLGLAVAVGDHLAAEADRVGAFAPFEFPGIAVDQPGLRQLDLPAVVDALAEHAVHIADAVAVGGQIERGQALHEAGRQPPQAAVAQGRVRLDLADDVEIDAQRGQGRAQLVDDAQVGQGIAQQPADQELEAEVVDPFGARGVRRASRGHPAVDHLVAHGEHGGGQPVVRLGGPGVLADPVHQSVENSPGQRRDRARSRRRLVRRAR